MHINKAFFSLTLLGLFSLNLAACRQPMEQMMDQGTTTSPMTSARPDSSAMPHDMGNMDLGTKNEHFDLLFIDGMILHHQGAIVMAEAAFKNSQRPEIKELAQNIITAQQTEIAKMQEWRKTWYADVENTPMMYHADAKHMMPMSDEMRSDMMMDVDLGEADAEFDKRFIDAMIPHHEGALQMAEQVLKNSDRPEVLELAKNIISSQQVEIDQMQTWRTAWYK